MSGDWWIMMILRQRLSKKPGQFHFIELIDELISSRCATFVVPPSNLPIFLPSFPFEPPLQWIQFF